MARGTVRAGFATSPLTFSAPSTPDERKKQEHRGLTDLGCRRHSDPLQVRHAHGKRADDHEQHEGRDLDDCQNHRQSRAGTCPADVHSRKHRVQRHESNDAPHAHTDRGNRQGERVHQEVRHRRAGHDRVRNPEERARDAADHRAECLGRVGVEPASVGDATPNFCQAEPDQATSTAQSRYARTAAGPSIAAAIPGNPKMPDPTMQFTAEAARPPTPITRSRRGAGALLIILSAASLPG